MRYPGVNLINPIIQAEAAKTNRLNRLSNTYDLQQRMNPNSLANQLTRARIELAKSQNNANQGFTLAPGQRRFDSQGKLIAEGGKKPKEDRSFDQEAKLRDKYQGQTKDFVKVRDAYGRIVSSAREPSAAGDLALIFNYMKVLDPGSTVREGEFATAQNAAGVPVRVRNLFNQIKSGERLSNMQRMDFLNRSKMLYGAQKKGYDKLRSQYGYLSQRYGLNPENVLIDYTVDYGDVGNVKTSGDDPLGIR